MIAVPTKGSNKLYDILYLEEIAPILPSGVQDWTCANKFHNLSGRSSWYDKAPAATSPDTTTGQARDPQGMCANSHLRSRQAT